MSLRTTPKDGFVHLKYILPKKGLRVALTPLLPRDIGPLVAFQLGSDQNRFMPKATFPFLEAPAPDVWTRHRLDDMPCFGIAYAR